MASSIKIFLSLMSISILFFACKTSNSASTGKDVGAVNIAKGESLVLYQDQGVVYLKNCEPVVVPPTRSCASEGPPLSMKLAQYIDKLPYDVGTYKRDDNSLAIVTKMFEDAHRAADAGNQQAAETLKTIEPIKDNLAMILKIRDALNFANNDLTVYEYDKDYVKILKPFGLAKLSDLDFPIPGMPPGTKLTMTRTVRIEPGRTFYLVDYDRQGCTIDTNVEGIHSIDAGTEIVLTGYFSAASEFVNRVLIATGAKFIYATAVVKSPDFIESIKCRMDKFNAAKFKNYFSSVGTWSR
jgi:hypothetical protein